MSPAVRTRRRTPSAGDLHRAWLELVDTDGPFLAVPALLRAYPQGIPQPPTAALDAVRDARPAFDAAWERWDRRRDAADALAAYRTARDAFVERVLRDGLGWGTDYVVTPAAEVRSPDHAVTVTATGRVADGDAVGALVLVVDPVDDLRDPLADGWATSPVDRLEELLRAAAVPVGLVTDGRWWAIVSARPEVTVASGVVDAQTWTEEPATRNAFLELASWRPLLGGEPGHRLTELFRHSVAEAEEITEALGVQVRRAVELLVAALSEAARDARGHGEPDPLPADRPQVYDAAVTVLMRVVFLLFAEERGLLPQGRLFTAGYGISGELDVLDERLRHETDQALDATHLTWHRLLATSRALYQGASFEDLRLPSYGGSLFDPARFPFLTARSKQGMLAVTVSDRVMLEVLRAVQVATVRGQARRISFRDIDVEQIGYIYEGLLGYSCAEVADTTLGLLGTPGEEPEMRLDALEELFAAHADPAKRAAAILTAVKASQPGAKAPSASALIKAIRGNDQVEDADRALRAVTSVPGLRDKLRPFVGIIRRDLRGRPLVVQRGGLVVVETASRATAGAHYTPRKLAEEVVQHALEPLVYQPGPHQEPDRDRWQPLKSWQLLDLKVADIACGSGAFLVAAARYLAERLIEAWQREKSATGTPRELRTRAVREVVANCLYGADINAMAVEMSKLSLWLVSLDPKLPFSFVDDKVLHGNSLLGLTDRRQLQKLNIDPAADEQIPFAGLAVDATLANAVRLRRALASEVDDRDPQRSAATKRRLWAEYQELVAELTDVADGVVAAGLRLGGKPGKALREAYANLQIAVGEAYPSGGVEPKRAMLDGILKKGLTPTVATDYARWKPLHWILQVPDVMERGGFDAVVGNPPFLGGQKLTGTMGTEVRDWFVHTLARGQRGSADLVAYFFLRATSLLTATGNLGLIATNSVAQGDTREVGLDRIVHDGVTIARAIQSRSWPAASANLEYAAVWGTRGDVDQRVPKIADGVAVARISTLLEAASETGGHPYRLSENAGLAFNGCKPMGPGFVLGVQEAADWIVLSPSNSQVVHPYLIGKDLNSSPEGAASRWVIDFYGLTAPQASQYALPFERVLQRVKGERERIAQGSARTLWWLFERSRPAMRGAINGLSSAIVLTQTSATQIPLIVDARQVFDQKLIVFASNDPKLLGIISSSVHRIWATCWGSTRTGDPVYTPSDVFETFPRPEDAGRIADVGKTLNTERREIMLRRQLGLTKLYNLVNDPDITDADADVARLRRIHVELDEAVMAAYGWQDVLLDHGFHTYRQMRRWTVSPEARVEILDRLLGENHRRAKLQGAPPPPAKTDPEEDTE